MVPLVAVITGSLARTYPSLCTRVINVQFTHKLLITTKKLLNSNQRVVSKLIKLKADHNQTASALERTALGLAQWHLDLLEAFGFFLIEWLKSIEFFLKAHFNI